MLIFLLIALVVDAAGTQPPLRFLDDRGQWIAAPLEVCFQLQLAPDCKTVVAGEVIHLPEAFTSMRIEGEDHGPLTLRRQDLHPQNDGSFRVTVRRKALLRIGGAARKEPLNLALYSPQDPTFREPFFRAKLRTGQTEVKVPAGTFITSLTMSRNAPDLHRLVAAPAVKLGVAYQPRPGWSLVARFHAAGTGSMVGGVAMKLAEARGYGERERPIGDAVSTADGIALISGIDASTASLSARHPGFLPAEAHGVVASPGTFALRDLQLSVGGRLLATVSSRDRPLAGSTCQLSALDASDPKTYYRTVWQGLTHADGVCRSDVLASGDYKLVVRVAGSAASDARWISVSEGQETTEKVAFFPTRVTGQVRRAAAPVADYSVQASRLVIEWPQDAPREPGAVATTDESGKYDLMLLVPGRYLLQLKSASGGWVGGHKELSTWGNEDKEVNFDLAAGSIHGTVVDETGTGVPAANVVASYHGGSSITATDGSGGFEVEAQDAGFVRLSAGKQGYRSPDPIEVEVGEGVPPVPPVTIVLKKGTTARGTLLSAAGIPVVGGMVSSIALTSQEPGLFASARSDLNGSFEIPVPPGQPLLFASGPGCSLFFLRMVQADDAQPGDAGTTLQCPEQPAALEVTVADGKGKPISSDGLILRTGGIVVPREVLAGHLLMMGLPIETDGAGHLVVPGLAPGDYDLFLGDRSSVATIAAGNQSGYLTTVNLPGLETVELQLTYDGAP